MALSESPKDVENKMADLHLELSGLQDELATITAAFQKRIDDVNERIRQQKEKLNSFTPIAQLPNEILERIFAIHRTSHLYQEDSANANRFTSAPLKDRWKIGPWNWIWVIHVCVRWRTVGLAQKELWRYISSRQPSEAIEESIKRSQPAPLWVSTHPFKTALVAQFHRVAFLELNITHMNTSPMDARCRDALAGTAPLLRRLRIFQTSYEYTEAVGIFQGGAPMLSTLILKDCYLPWTSPLFHPGLTTLQIRLPNNDPPHFAPEHLIDALGRVSSSLVVFELDPLPEVQFPVSRQVVLRKLEKLTLGCQRVEAIQSLFSHLIIPEKAVVHLSFESSPPMDVRMAHTRGDAPKPQSILPLRFFNTDILPPSKLQASPSSHSLAYTALPPRSLCLDLRETAACTTYTFNLWDHDVDFSLDPLPTSSLRCTVEDKTGYQQRWDTPPVEVFPCLSSRDIRSLSLNELPDMPLRRFEKLMSTSYSPSPSLSGVEDLYVVRRLSYRVVKFLMEEDPSGSNVGPPSGPQKILPLLRSLTFERIEFIEASRHRRPTINQIANGKPVVFEDLLQVLEFRAKSGAMIKTLRLMECYNLSVIQAEKLAQFVGEMAWNGERFSRGSTPQ